ncbi:hypothetical protein I3843_09G081200 [Carya illinoinensis]|uniref:Uncharacterized protein n=1 Tax=Carya illinoinensis TaxID=32201 RepID=A0A8T1PF81_CARIL|nr:putative receptor-like protein kinase At4g00960 isoform X2 [Carya illinoinensis]KAG6641565.1 hypothetical protein CIPAW_09G082700 [Carya illinoinensis]KAG7962751.1 hypothetical protein I3843_09G081200 [Carya illinoinensis]
MCYSNRLLLLGIVLSLHFVTPTAQSIYCDLTGNYTSNSAYRANLVGLLASMSSNTKIDYGFYNFTAGENSDKVNAIALCRGDFTPDKCRSCINSTSQRILQSCPNQKEAISLGGDCTVRYSNRSIFGVMEENPMLAIYNVQNISLTDPEGFTSVLRPLLDRLINSTALGSSTRKFALGSEDAPDSQKIYALLQCTPDLNPEDCNSCLLRLRDYRRECCNGQKVGGVFVTPSCYLRYEIYSFYDPAAESPPPSPPAPPIEQPVPPAPPLLPPTQGTKRNTTTRTVIAVVPTLVGIILVISIIYLFLRVRKRKDHFENMDEIGNIESLQFDFDVIRAATCDFSDANKVGKGGFGPVYEGKLPNGQEIAVKRLSRNSGQGNLEFKNEVVLVAKLQHRNLVRLLGFCLEGNERLLVYEFVPNNSLDRYIFDPKKSANLDWESRYKIIKGIARGLLYLHEDSRLRIIHRDLKAANVLLDIEMNPKISDFGMARMCVLDQTEGSTNRIVGTYGYMAPEYAMLGQFSIKSDVFSFGVLMLEIVSGQKITSFREGENREYLLSYAWKNWSKGTAANLIDLTLRSGPLSEMIRCIHIGLLCVQANVADRLDMASVVLMLNSNSIALPLPTQPASFMQNGVPLATSMKLDTDCRPVSHNEVSITELGPR